MKNLICTTAKDRPKTFAAVMTVVMLFIKLPFAPLIGLGGGGTTEDLMEIGLAIALISFLILPLETLLGQQLPVWAFQRVGVRRWRWLILGSITVFGALHLPAGIGAFFVGFSGGIALAVCWLAWREVSWKRAFLWTTGVHAAHNAIALVLFVALFS